MSNMKAENGISLLQSFELENYLDLDFSRVNDYSDIVGIWAMINNLDYCINNSEKSLIKNVNQAYKQNNLDIHVLYKYGLYANSVAGSIKNIDIKLITESYNNLVIHGRKELDITSDEIMEILNKSPGEYMSKIYEDVEHEVLYKNIPNNKESISNYIKAKYKD